MASKLTGPQQREKVRQAAIKKRNKKSGPKSNPTTRKAAKKATKRISARKINLERAMKSPYKDK